MAQDGASRRTVCLIYALLGMTVGFGLLGTAMTRKPYSDHEDLEAHTMGHLKIQNEELRRRHSDGEVRSLPARLIVSSPAHAVTVGHMPYWSLNPSTLCYPITMPLCAGNLLGGTCYCRSAAQAAARLGIHRRRNKPGRQHQDLGLLHAGLQLPAA